MLSIMKCYFSKLSITGLLMASFIIQTFAGDVQNLLQNGDFGLGSYRWGGDAKSGVIESNKCLYLEANKESYRETKQDITMPKSPSLEVKLRFRVPKDSEKTGFEIQFVKKDADPSDAILDRNSFSFHKKDEWKEISWVLKTPNYGKKVEFKLTIGSGKGKIYFDDISITPSDKTPDEKRD